MGKIYISPSSIAKETSKIYFGNSNNVAQEIKRAYVGDSNGVARMVFGPPYGPPPILPDAYQQVEYIYTSARGAYIDTGLTFTSSVKMYAKIQYPTLTSGGNDGQWNGTEDTTSKKHSFGYYRQTSGLSKLAIYLPVSYSSGTGHNSVTIDANTNVHEFIIDGPQKKISIDSNSQSASSGRTVRSASYTHILFGCNHGGGTIADKCIERIYSFKWYSNGTLNHNYYPCYRKADNVVGFYDLLANVFKTNQGSNSLHAGPDYIGEL